MCGSRGGQGVGTPPLKNHKKIGYLSNTGPDPLKNYKATKPAFNFGPTSARQFRWRADDGPLILVFGSFLPSSTKKTHKKTLSRMDPLWQNCLNPRMSSQTTQIAFFIYWHAEMPQIDCAPRMLIPEFHKSVRSLLVWRCSSK